MGREHIINPMHAALLDACEELTQARRELMLAQSALGEVRACLEGHGGNIAEIIEHYRTVEGVPMPHALDEEE